MAKKQINITLYKSELIYDVQNKTYLTGRSRNTGNNHEEVANMQANDDEENANQIVRSIGNAFYNLKTKLSEYLVETGNDADNILMQNEADGILSMSLTMPCNYNASTRETIATAIHQYIVNSAVGEWFTITNKNDAGEYIALASAQLATIREALNKRVRPQRPPRTESGSGSENNENSDDWIIL